MVLDRVPVKHTAPSGRGGEEGRGKEMGVEGWEGDGRGRGRVGEGGGEERGEGGGGGKEEERKERGMDRNPIRVGQ